MSSCGRDNDGDDENATTSEAPLIANAKPGSSPITNTATTDTNCDTKSGGCKSTEGGECASKECNNSTSSSSSSYSTATLLTHAEHAALVTATAVVPPPRATSSSSTTAAAKRAAGPSSLCSKCRLVPSQVNLRDAITCGPCFAFLFVARVKSTLRNRCVMPKAPRFLLGISGGTCSSSLARILSLASDPNQARRLFFEADLIHIDESCLDVEPQYSETFEKDVINAYESWNGRVYHVKLEEVMNLGTEFEAPPLDVTAKQVATAASSTSPTSSSSVTAIAPSSTTHVYLQLPTANLATNRTTLQSLFSSLRDPSDRADFLHLLRMRLLCHITRLYGYAQLLLGNSASKSASDIFSDTSKGRGAYVPLIQQFIEDRWQTQILYPFKEQSSVQASLFNHFMRVPTQWKHTWDTKTKGMANVGLNKLTHDFLCMLDAKFSSTVSNIFNSIHKLALPVELTSKSSLTSSSHCALCARPIIAAEGEENARTLHAGVGKREITPDNKLVMSKITMCYGCEALVAELGVCSLLPTYILQGAHRDHLTPQFASTYPSSHYSTMKSTQLTHAERAERNREKREALEATQQKAESREDTEERSHQNLNADERAERHARNHGELQKQTREDMKASFAEFVLTDD